jgi:hypothetical protein
MGCVSFLLLLLLLLLLGLAGGLEPKDTRNKQGLLCVHSRGYCLGWLVIVLSASRCLHQSCCSLLWGCFYMLVSARCSAIARNALRAWAVRSTTLYVVEHRYASDAQQQSILHHHHVTH